MALKDMGFNHVIVSGGIGQEDYIRLDGQTIKHTIESKMFVMLVDHQVYSPAPGQLIFMVEDDFKIPSKKEAHGIP